VQFKGESGVDAAGVTTAMYTRFFSQVIQEQYGLFEHADGGIHYLPKSNAKLDLFTTFGRILIKCIYDGRIVPITFAPSFFKYMLSVQPQFRDLEVYDPSLAHSFKKILADANVDNLELYFDDLVLNGDTIKVTNANKHEYIRAKVQHILINIRQLQLGAIMEGFHCIYDLKAHMELFSYIELRMFIRGSDFISSETIKDCLVFLRFGPEFPDKFTRVITELNQHDLRRFLWFVTEQENIPLGGLNNPNIYAPRRDKISIHKANNPESYPVAHVCFYSLEITEETDIEKLREKLLYVLSNTQNTFELY